MRLDDFELQVWTERHRDEFVHMHGDPAVMEDLGGPFVRDESNAKFDRYRDAWEMHGTSRWAIVDRDSLFLGYAGVMKRDDPNHPLGVHHEVGWRLCRHAWGHGYALRSARRALDHAW